MSVRVIRTGDEYGLYLDDKLVERFKNINEINTPENAERLKIPQKSLFIAVVRKPTYAASLTDNMPDCIELAKLKSGREVVRIGDFYISVKFKESMWRFRYMADSRNPKTAWMTMVEAGDLRTSHKAKVLRDILKNKYGDRFNIVLEYAICIIQDNEEKWLPKEEEKKKEELQVSEEIKSQARELLEDSLLLYRIKKDMEKWIVGEERTSLLNLLLGISCKSKKDYAFQLISSESAAGKTWIVRHMLKYLPEEWWRKVGRLSRTALERLKDQDFDLLWIQERRGGKEASESIRLSSVEDGGTEVWVTERSDDKGFETQQYTVPGRSIITTTTRTDIDPQDLTRSWILSIDETEEQTKRIHDYQAKDVEKPFEFRSAIGEVGEDLRPVIHEALRQLDWNQVVIIPFASELKRFVDSSILRSRRDFKKLIRLVRVITLIFQRQRRGFEMNGIRFLVSFPQDVYMALMIGEETFERTSRGLDKREKKVIDELKKSKGEMTKRAIATNCGKSTTWTYNILKELINKGYVYVDESEKAHKYGLQKELPNLSTSVSERLDWSVLEKKVVEFLIRSPVTITSRRAYSFQYVNPITGEDTTNKMYSKHNMLTGVTVTGDEVEHRDSSVAETEQEDATKTAKDRLKSSKAKKDSELDEPEAPVKLPQI